MNLATVLQVASGLGGLTVLISLISLPWVLKKLRSDTRKTDAEGVKFLTESAVAFLAPARAEIGELEKSLRAAKARVDELEAEVQQLRNQVSEMSKELTELKDENHKLRTGEGRP